MACSIPAYSCGLGCLHFSPHFSDCFSIRPSILRRPNSPSKGFNFQLRFSISTPLKHPFFLTLFLCWVFRFRTKHRIFNQQLKMLFSMPFFLLLRDTAPVFLRYCTLFCMCFSGDRNETIVFMCFVEIWEIAAIDADMFGSLCASSSRGSLFKAL